MTDKSPNPRRSRFYVEVAAGLLVLAAFVATGWYVSSPHFKNLVRNRVIAFLEQATGGRAEIGQLRWTLWKLEFEARDVTVHGRETAGEIPYLHAERVHLEAKIISALKRKVGLRSLELDRPVLHLIVYPDGTTNQPVPPRKSGRSPIESMFDVAAERVEVRNGELRINDRPIPIDFAATDVAAAMTYDAAGPRYHGTVHAGKIDAKFKDMRPFAAIADAQFSLAGRTLDVRSLAITSGESNVRASGLIQDISIPTVDVTYRATLNLREVGAISRTPQLKLGQLELEGRGTYTEAAFLTSGKLVATGVDWYDRNVRLRDASATSEYRVDSRRIALPNLSGRLLGGKANGQLEIVNWRNSQQGDVTQRGTGRFEVTGLAIGELARAISSRTLPLDRMNLAGATSGRVVTTWTGQPSNVIAEMNVAVTPPQSPSAQQVPVTATMRGRYDGRGGVLNVAAASIRTPATSIDATGMLGSTRADLQVKASTSNLGELTPIIAAQGQYEHLPLELHGRAAFNGAIAGRFAQPSIAGQLQITDFESIFEPAAALRTIAQSQPQTNASGPTAMSAGPFRRMHWDALSTTIQYSSSVLVLRNGVLRRGAAQVSFDLNARLRGGRFTEETPFSGHVSASNAQIADLQTLAGYTYPITGTIDFQAQLSGTQVNPQGQGHVTIRKATVHGQPVARAASDLKFANQELQFTNIEVGQNGARVLGAAAYNVHTRAYRFRLRGDSFKLASFAALQTQRIKVDGLMNFDADGSGTPEAPVVNANVHVADMIVNGERVGELAAQARTVGETLTLTARSNISSADLTLNGTVRLRDDYPATVSARFVHLDLDPLLQAYFRGTLTGHSSFAGTIEARGPVRRVRDMTVEGELSQFYIPVENIQVRNQGPIRFGIARQVLDVRALHLLAEETDFTATGQAELAGEHQLNFAALGRANLKLVQTLSPDYVSYGNLSMDVRVNGTIANPVVNGRVQVANAGISYVDLPNGLSDINGTLVFNRDRLQIQHMTGRTGGGTLDLTGYVTYARTIGFNIQAAAKDIRLRYPPGVSAVADANVRFSGTLRNSLLSGDVTVTRFGLNPRFDFAMYLARSKQGPELTDLDSPLNNVKLDLHVTSTPELQVQTSLAKLSGNVDLRLRGTAARPSVLGRVDIVEGDVFFNGTKYHVERGDITFTNPTRVEPVLDIEASTHVRDYDITLGFHGPVEKLSTTYRSDPPLATADIIALLAFGRTREESAMQPVSSQNFTETASNAILGQALNATVSSRVQRLFGVSRIKIDPQVGGAENNPSGARVTIEQQVANDLTITYITDLARSNQQIISLEYNITRAVSVLAVRDQNGIVSFDIRIRQRKR